MVLLNESNGNIALDLDTFKSEYKNLIWYRVPRVLSEDHQDYFFIADYENDDFITRLVIKPTKEIAITETYKYCNEQGVRVGKEVPGRKYESGLYIELPVSDGLLEAIKVIAIEKPRNIKQIVSL